MGPAVVIYTRPFFGAHQHGIANKQVQAPIKDNNCEKLTLVGCDLNDKYYAIDSTFVLIANLKPLKWTLKPYYVVT